MNSANTMLAAKDSEFDFSQPLPLSDVVLLVEEERFHVHRSILAMCSPVFARMFTSGFKERLENSIPLPGKKAHEIREMLLVIYPDSQKPVDESNCYFLLPIGQEYQMNKLTQKCEDVLLRTMKSSHVLDQLILSEKYDLTRLRAQCIEMIQRLDLRVLQRYETDNELTQSTQKEIVAEYMRKLEQSLREAQGEVERLQKQVASMKRWASDGLSSVERLASVLAGHIRISRGVSLDAIKGVSFTTEQDLSIIRADADKRSYYESRMEGNKGCMFLDSAYDPLFWIRDTLTRISKSS